MGLRSDPVGGGQFKQLLQQTLEAERQPIKNLEKQKGIQDAKLKLFQEFKGKFTGLQGSVNDLSNFKKFVEYKVDLGEGANLMSVTVDKEKVKAGSYVMEIRELAERSAMISNGFEKSDEANLGIGFVVVYQNDGNKFEVFVDEKDSSLRGIAKLINDVPDSPIHASVIRDGYSPDQPWKLIVSAKKDGDPSGVEFPEFYFLDGKKDIWIDDDKESRNAVISVDGFPIEAESNDVTDFLDGVNIHLKGAKPDQPFTLTIREDVEKISSKVQKLVDNTNEVLRFINLQNQVNESSDTTKTFTGDTSLQAIEYRMRNLLHEGFPHGEYDTDNFRLVWLNQMGIEFGKDGLLKFSGEKFNQVLEKDFDAVAEAISGERGFAFQIGEVLKLYTRPNDGLLAMREKGIQNRIKEVDQRIEVAERRFESRGKSLTDKFAKMEASLGALQQQQQYMSATLGSIGGGGMTTQLMGGR